LGILELTKIKICLHFATPYIDPTITDVLIRLREIVTAGKNIFKMVPCKRCDMSMLET